MLIFANAGLKFHRLLLNDLKTNCFVVQRGDEAILVDPTDRAEAILDYLREHGLRLRYMLTTHGHFDHVSGAAGVVDSGLVDTLYVHEKDFREVRNAQSYSAMIFKKKMRVPPLAMFSADLLALLEQWGLRVEHAGGHTRGSCFLHSLAGDIVITGDLALHHKLNITLFDNRENVEEFYRFIERVRTLFDMDTVILPGHGDPTTVGIELEKNRKWAYIRQKQGHGH